MPGPARTTVRRRPASIGLAVAATVVLAGCGATAPAAPAPPGFPVTVSSCGQQVTFQRPPTRVLAERETSTVVAAAGAADRVVARSGEGGLPLGPYADQLSRVPQVTETSNDPPSREAVLGQQAELVTAAHVQPTDVTTLQQVGVDVLVPPWFCGQVAPGAPPAVGFDALYSTLADYGRVFDTQDAAARTAAELRGRVSAVEQHVGSKPEARPRTAANLFVGSGQLFVFGGPSVNTTVMRSLGLTNVFADVNARSSEVNPEAVLARNPDVVILSFNRNAGLENGADAVRTVSQQPAINQLAALRDHRVLAINNAYLSGGPLAVDGLEMLARQLDGMT